MLSLLARLIIAAPKRVLAAVLLLTVVAAAFGATVTEHLGAAGFQDPSSPSARGMKVLTTKLGQGDMDLALVVRAPGSVQDPPAAAAGRNLVKELRRSEFVNDVESPWDGSPQSAGLISKDGTTALVITGITGSGVFLRGRNFGGVYVFRHCHVDDRRYLQR
jgi:putative drug exporter of the RND superfamily